MPSQSIDNRPPKFGDGRIDHFGGWNRVSGGQHLQNLSGMLEVPEYQYCHDAG